MENHSDKSSRRSIRLPNYDYTQSGAYFVTVCTYNHECLFGSIVNQSMQVNEAGRIVQTVWDELPERLPDITLDAFVVMPNHIHGIIMLEGIGNTNVGAPLAAPAGRASPAPTSFRNIAGQSSNNPTLSDVMRAFKSISAIHVNRHLKRKGPLWQRNYYEHVIRSEESLYSIREYITNNPLGWEIDNENPANRGM